MKLGAVSQTVLRAQMLVHIWCEILYMSSDNTILLSVCEFYENGRRGGHTLF